MKTLQASGYRLFLNIVRITAFFVVFFGLILFFIYHQNIRDGAVLTQMYMMMITFFWLIYFIIQKGDLFEKHLIRYFVEAEEKRYSIILAFYFEAVMTYFVSIALFVLLLTVIGISVNIVTLALYFLLYILIVSIVLNLVLLVQKTSTALIVAILLIWVLPDMVNYAANNAWMYEFQPAFYLSPSTFIKDTLTTTNFITYSIYLFISLVTSFIVFEKAEL